MQKALTRFLFALVLILFGYLSWLWLSPQEESPPGLIQTDAQTAAVAVEIAAIEQANIQDRRRFTGTLYAEAQFEVAPRIGGKLESLLVDIGDQVEKGELVARLDDAEYQQQVLEARAAVQVAKATLAEARSSLDAKQKELQRTQQLREQRIASESELDTVQAEAVAQRARVSLAEAQVSQAEAALRAAEVRLSYTTISADWDNGDQQRVVGERFVDEGTTISANSPIVSVLDIRQLTAVIYVTERDYPQLNIGQPVTIIADAYPNVSFEGEIRRIAPMFREASRQARIEIRIPNLQRMLKPGMFVSAQIELENKTEATVVPFDALVERNDEPGVFVVDRETLKAHFVSVEIGISEGEKIEIVEPELVGEVVTLGQHLLNDGSKIVISDEDKPSSEATTPDA